MYTDLPTHFWKKIGVPPPQKKGVSEKNRSNQVTLDFPINKTVFVKSTLLVSWGVGIKIFIQGTRFSILP